MLCPEVLGEDSVLISYDSQTLPFLDSRSELTRETRHLKMGFGHGPIESTVYQPFSMLSWFALISKNASEKTERKIDSVNVQERPETGLKVGAASFRTGDGQGTLQAMSNEWKDDLLDQRQDHHSLPPFSIAQKLAWDAERRTGWVRETHHYHRAESRETSLLPPFPVLFHCYPVIQSPWWDSVQRRVGKRARGDGSHGLRRVPNAVSRGLEIHFWNLLIINHRVDDIHL